MENQTPQRPILRSTPARTAADVQHAGAAGLKSEGDRAADIREPLGDAAPEEITRVSRTSVASDVFWIPVGRKKLGWDYEYKAIRVLGQPVDGSEESLWYQQGWRPEKARDWPELCPPGFVGESVERGGQRLYGRPAHLTAEAKAEDYAAAEQQKMDRVRAAADGRASGGAIADVKGVNVKPLGLEIQGEAGTYSRK